MKYNLENGKMYTLLKAFVLKELLVIFRISYDQKRISSYEYDREAPEKS